MSSLRVALMLAVLLLSGCAEHDQSPAISKGDYLPEFSLQMMHGGAVSSKEFAGKWLILNVWATWCGPCRHELPSLQRLSDRLDAKQWRVVGLALETDGHAVREYLAEKRIVYENYLDAGTRIDKAVLGVPVLPATYVIGPDGRVRDVVLGDRVWDSDDMMDYLLSLK